MTVNKYQNNAFSKVRKVGKPDDDTVVFLHVENGEVWGDGVYGDKYWGFTNFEEAWPTATPPDNEDLQIHYDWSKENGSLPVIDWSGNGNDLDLGGYSGTSVSINGVQAGDFAGGGTAAEDWVGGEGFTTVEPPYHDFIVLEPRNVSNTQYLLSLMGSSHPSVRSINSNDTWAARPNSNDANVDGSGVDTPILLEIVWKESETTIHNVTAGFSDIENETAGQSTSLRIARRDGSGFYLNAKIGEHLRYSKEKTNRTDVHSYLNKKWGVDV